MASRVRPTLTGTDLVDIFMGMLQILYYEKMVGSSSSNFSDLVTNGERIESGLKTGKIVDGSDDLVPLYWEKIIAFVLKEKNNVLIVNAW